MAPIAATGTCRTTGITRWRASRAGPGTTRADGMVIRVETDSGRTRGARDLPLAACVRAGVSGRDEEINETFRPGSVAVDMVPGRCAWIGRAQLLRKDVCRGGRRACPVARRGEGSLLVLPSSPLAITAYTSLFRVQFRTHLLLFSLPVPGRTRRAKSDELIGAARLRVPRTAPRRTDGRTTQFRQLRPNGSFRRPL